MRGRRSTKLSAFFLTLMLLPRLPSSPLHSTPPSAIVCLCVRVSWFEHHHPQRRRQQRQRQGRESVRVRVSSRTYMHDEQVGERCDNTHDRSSFTRTHSLLHTTRTHDSYFCDMKNRCMTSSVQPQKVKICNTLLLLTFYQYIECLIF